MKQRKYLELSRDDAREYQLLKRRLEWLELRNSVGYRMSGERRAELDQIYGDISDGRAFCEKLANIQDGSIQGTLMSSGQRGLLCNL
jgi:hypothetical protein